MHKFDINHTLDGLKAIGRVIDYWKEKSYDGGNYKRRVLVELGGKVISGHALPGTNQYQYRTKLDGGREVIICINSNHVFEVPAIEAAIKTVLRKKA